MFFMNMTIKLMSTCINYTHMNDWVVFMLILQVAIVYLYQNAISGKMIVQSHEAGCHVYGVM